MVQGKALNTLHILNLDPPFIDSKSDASMYALVSAKVVLVDVCSVYKITGIECIRNPFLSQYVYIRSG